MDGSIVATWWLPEFGGDWRQDNLTDLFGGPQVYANSIDSYFKNWGGQNIAGVDKNTGELVVYWWAPGVPNNAWQIAEFDDLLPGADAPYSNVSVGSVPGGDTHIFATNDDGDIVRYSWDIGGNGWSFENLTETAELS